MREDHRPRLFESDGEVRRIGEGLIACRLTRADWTHEAHLAACLWIIVERQDIVAERDLGEIIRRFNVSVGGVNDDTQGYHETITQCFISGVRRYLGRCDPALPIARKVNGLLQSEEGERQWPLHFYSRELLFSVPARLGFVTPDLAPLPGH